MAHEEFKCVCVFLLVLGLWFFWTLFIFGKSMQARVTREEGNSTEKNTSIRWPIGEPVGHFLD